VSERRTFRHARSLADTGVKDPGGPQDVVPIS
jgi:hypothetical protein